MSQVKERPILFSAPMVRAILEDRKTATRRPVKGGQIPTEDTGVPVGERHRWSAIGQQAPRYGFNVFGETADECAKELAEFGRCPYGKPGDRLWVRETWAEIRVAQAPGQEWIVYRECDNRTDYGGPWKPSIFMPRRACRILLEITDVRVERLKDISDEQAQAEGCFFTDWGKQCFHGGHGWKDVGDCPAVAGHQQREGWMWDKTTSHEQCLGSARHAFGNLWNKVNGPEAWDANPWVWVVEFKRVQP